MKNVLVFFVSAAIVLLLSASLCRKATDSGVPTGCNFYYWKTKLEFTHADKALADSLGMKRLYLRFFDVDWSPTLEMPVPVGEMGFEENFTGNPSRNDLQIADFQLVPTVYIVNRVFEKKSNMDSLAARVTRRVMDKSQSLSYWSVPWGYDFYNAELPDGNRWERMDSLEKAFLGRIDELQIDCDWTPSTRERYFQFLKAMKKANPGRTISCTVRLHQFRDREQTGVPPVERGTLMCYNMAAPKDIGVNDAIFDPALVNGYLKSNDYPFALEAALPLFSWGALFHENQFKGLAAGLSEAAVKGNPLFSPVSEGRYRFTQDTVFANIYMREGDIVRLDEPSREEVIGLAKRLAEIKAVKNISFFDWNPSKIRAYHVDEICKTYASGR